MKLLVVLTPPSIYYEVTYNGFMNIPKYDKYCGIVDGEYVLCNELNLCAKIFMHRKCLPSTIILRR